MKTLTLAPQYQTILDAWNANDRPGLTACTTCHHRVVTKVDGVDVVACSSPDVTTKAVICPVGQARSTKGPCGPEAVFWLHPSDAKVGKSRQLELAPVDGLQACSINGTKVTAPSFSGSLMTAAERAAVWAQADKRGQT